MIADDHPFLSRQVPQPPEALLRQARAHAVRLAALLGVDRPHVGVLAPSEDVTATVPSTGEAAAIAAWAKGRLRRGRRDGRPRPHPPHLARAAAPRPHRLRRPGRHPRRRRPRPQAGRGVTPLAQARAAPGIPVAGSPAGAPR